MAGAARRGRKGRDNQIPASSWGPAGLEGGCGHESAKGWGLRTNLTSHPGPLANQGCSIPKKSTAWEEGPGAEASPWESPCYPTQRKWTVTHPTAKGSNCDGSQNAVAKSHQHSAFQYIHTSLSKGATTIGHLDLKLQELSNPKFIFPQDFYSEPQLFYCLILFLFYVWLGNPCFTACWAKPERSYKTGELRRSFSYMLKLE